MRSVSLDFLINEVDMLFTEFQTHYDNKYLDMAFYDKTYDGGENHEIHIVWTVHHDETNLSKPYIITKYIKEYMWNMLTSFQQTDYDVVEVIEKNTINEVIDYLIEKDVVLETFTYPYPDKNPKIMISKDTKKITYSLCVAWVDKDVNEGDYSDLYTFTLDTATIPKEKLNKVHETILQYFTHTHNNLIVDNNPETIINKLNRMKKGPFTPYMPDNLSLHYKFWDTSSDDNDMEEENKNIITSDHYTLHKHYSINSVRVDVIQFDVDDNMITGDLVKQFNFSDEEIYTEFNTYMYKYDLNKKIWLYNNDPIEQTNSKTDIFDSYWSMSENRLYDQSELEIYTTYIIQTRIDTAMNTETTTATDTADTADTTDTADTADTTDTADTDSADEHTDDNDMVILDKPHIDPDTEYFPKGLSCSVS